MPTPASSVASSSRSGPSGSGGSDHVNSSGKWKLVGRVVLLGQRQHEVLERQQRAGVDLEGEVEVERAAAGLLGVEVDLPRLAQGVGLDEVPLVVHVEAVVDGVVLEVGDEPGDVDGGQGPSLPRRRGRPKRAAPGPVGSPAMRDDLLLEVLHDTATAVRTALDGLADWGDAGTRPGQYLSDLAADEVALAVLDRAGLGALSEESGLHHGDRDGRGGARSGRRQHERQPRTCPGTPPACARSTATVPAPRSWSTRPAGRRFEAVRGGGARVDGVPLRPTGCTDLGEALVGLSGYPPRWFGWKQFRALGAVALDLCAVAGGRLDAYVDCSPSAHGAWDYLGGMLVCQEAGAVVVDAWDRPLVTLDHAARRTPVAAATPELLAASIEARRGFVDHPVSGGALRRGSLARGTP